MRTYDKQSIIIFITESFTDIMILLLNKKYIFDHNNEDFSNLGEPSKSYIRVQFYLDSENNILYLSYILDPNAIWRNISLNRIYYDHINAYLLDRFKNSYFSGLRLEILLDAKSLKDVHEVNSKCITEETNRALYDDTVSVWTSIDGMKRFIRNRSILINDKNKVYFNTGKESFSDYRADVKSINNFYKDRLVTDNDSIIECFNEYKDVYESYFERELKVVDDSKLVRFRLLDFTDYDILKRV